MKNKRIASRLMLAALIAVFGIVAAPVDAGVEEQIGSYEVELATDPATIPIGRVNVYLKLTDREGNPVEGADIVTLVKMPTMDMGEAEQRAVPQPGEPGVYMAPAVFAMEGPYVAQLQISGPLGAASGDIELATGMNTGTLGGGAAGPSPVVRALPWLIGLALLVFVVYRMRRTGQRVQWRDALHWQFLAGVAVLAVMVAFSVYAVNNWRRPGAMTPIEAQAMEMNTPAPPGTAPVELVEVTRGPVADTVRYTGQAVGYVEQDVYPRVRGWITWMPFYAGDRVKKGQVIARLDTSEIDPQIAEREAMASMAQQGASVARSEFRQSLEEVNASRAGVRGKQSALRDARASLAAAREDRRAAEAELTAAETMQADAEAQVDAAKADSEYWQAQIARTRALLKEGVVSGEEFQREKAQAENAAARVRQAQARLAQVKADIRRAESGVRKADAMIDSATARVAQMTSELEMSRADVRTAQASAEAARERIGQAQAGVSQARAAVAATATQKGYSEIKSLVDGVVTERLISPGVLVNPGQAILKVAQIQPIRLQANVAEADLKRIAVGATVFVRDKDGNGKPVAARVTSIAPRIDPTTRTGVVEAVVPNKDERFLPGEYVVMDIVLSKLADALRVPTAAVQQRTRASGGILSTDTTSYVWVAEPVKGAEGQYTVRPVSVEIGLRSDETAAVISGLDEGQQVVLAGYQYLNEGDTVVPVSDDGTHTANAAPDGTEAMDAHAGHGM